MTADQFRELFRLEDHLMRILRQDGSLALAVGLNGDNAVLHRDGEIALETLHDTPHGVWEIIAG
jgi:hypothetical protein